MAATKKNAGKYSFRKTKKVLKKHGHAVKSSKRRKHVTKGARAWADRHLVDVYTKKNPAPPLDRWIPARRVKVVRKNGREQLIIEKPRAKRRRK